MRESRRCRTGGGLPAGASTRRSCPPSVDPVTVEPRGGAPRQVRKRRMCGPTRVAVVALLCLLPVLSGLAGNARAQTAGATAPSQSGAAPDVTPEGMVFSSPGQELDALEHAVQSSEYRLGPGDRLAINLWGESPLSFDLRVTLQGTLVIPQVDEVDVNGLTLDEARTRIGEHLSRRFRNQQFTVTLLQLRRFQVHVTGQVAHPGAVLATALDRVLDVIARAGGPLEDSGLRRVEILHRDGSVRSADVFRYIRTGDIHHNPHLQDGDVIRVPFRGSQVYLYGAVHSPGPYEYLETDSLGELLDLSGGLTDDARADSVEITRFTDPTETRRFFVSLAASGAGVPDTARSDTGQAGAGGSSPGESDAGQPGAAMPGTGMTAGGRALPLRAGDQIFVRRQGNWFRRQLVDVHGEVQYPGSFAIIEGETRLSEIIRRAGGFTEDAFLPEATIIRRQTIPLQDKEYERLKGLPPSEMTQDEYDYFKMKSREEKGLMVVDFTRLFRKGDKSQDIALMAGDLIDVPPRKNFVSVLGQVAFPGNVIHQPGLGVQQYIQRVGGYSDRADKGDVRVIRVATGEWVQADRAGLLEPGDTIWVPEKADRDYWNIFKESLTVVTQVLTVYLIVDRATQ